MDPLAKLTLDDVARRAVFSIQSLPCGIRKSIERVVVEPGKDSLVATAPSIEPLEIEAVPAFAIYATATLAVSGQLTTSRVGEICVEWRMGDDYKKCWIALGRKAVDEYFTYDSGHSHIRSFEYFFGSWSWIRSVPLSFLYCIAVFELAGADVYLAPRSNSDFWYGRQGSDGEFVSAAEFLNNNRFAREFTFVERSGDWFNVFQGRSVAKLIHHPILYPKEEMTKVGEWALRNQIQTVDELSDLLPNELTLEIRQEMPRFIRTGHKNSQGERFSVLMYDGYGYDDVVTDYRFALMTPFRPYGRPEKFVLYVPEPKSLGQQEIAALAERMGLKHIFRRQPT